MQDSILWNLRPLEFVFSGSNKDLSSELFHTTYYIYSPWKVWKRMQYVWNYSGTKVFVHWKLKLLHHGFCLNIRLASTSSIVEKERSDKREIETIFWLKKMEGTLYIINRGYILPGCAEIWNFSSSVEIFFQHEKRHFISPSGHVIFYLLYKHQWTTIEPFHFNSFFGVKGATYYVAIAMVIFSHVKIAMLFSHVKISSLRSKAHLVYFHWIIV